MHPGRMPKRRRLAVFLIVGALWLSGCVWLCLDLLFATHGPFGVIPHPWEPPMLLVHAITAILSMYLFGWISARHVLRWWPARLRRVSGGTLAALLGVLIVSGFALFFVSDDDWQHRVVLIHEVLGVGVTVVAIQHWFFRGRRDSPS